MPGGRWVNLGACGRCINVDVCGRWINGSAFVGRWMVEDVRMEVMDRGLRWWTESAWEDCWRLCGSGECRCVGWCVLVWEGGCVGDYMKVFRGGRKSKGIHGGYMDMKVESCYR